MEIKSFLMKFFNYKTSKNSLILKQIFIYLIILFGGTIDLEEVKSETCNANPSSTYESWWGDGSNTSWSELVGNCDKTPEEYGVTVYKMGFCTTNPFEGLAYDGTPGGVSPNFNDCSWSYENSNGEFQMFGPNSSTKLNAAFSKRPNNGSYSFAVIEIGPYISIKQMYGPIEGKTFYTSNYLDQHNGSIATTNSDFYSRVSIPQKTFQTEMCNSAAQGLPITGEGTLSGYLLNSSYQTFAQAGTGRNNTTVEDCGENIHRILGVMDLRASASGPGPVSISNSTAGLTVLFNVTNIGSNIYNNEIGDSNPLSILYPSGTLPNGLIDEDFQYGALDRNKFIGITTGPFSATFIVVEN